MSAYVTTMNSIAFPPELFETFKTGTALDALNRFALNDYAMHFLAGKKRDIREYEYVNV